MGPGRLATMVGITPQISFCSNSGISPRWSDLYSEKRVRWEFDGRVRGWEVGHKHTNRGGTGGGGETEGEKPWNPRFMAWTVILKKSSFLGGGGVLRNGFGNERQDDVILRFNINRPAHDGRIPLRGAANRSSYSKLDWRVWLWRQSGKKSPTTRVTFM